MAMADQSRCNSFGCPQLLKTTIQRSKHVRMVCMSSRKDDAASASKELRRLLESPGLYLGPACHDALSAKLVQNAGFSFTFMSGFAVSAARLACPDAGLISYGEMVDQARNITSAVSIPVIGDGDNGYGNAVNVKRTVKGYIQAGLAGILLEDQISPKACGHTRGRKVMNRNEAVARVRAAVDARKEVGSDLVIVARTDARQAVNMEEALWRVSAFADAGADVLFVDALASKEEMNAFCKTASPVPKMANMLEGGGKTPVLSPAELEELGFKLVAYPLSLLGVSIRAMQDALGALKSGRLPTGIPSFEEVKDVVGFNAYYAEEQRYAVEPGASEFSSDGGRTVTELVVPDVLQENDWDKKQDSQSILSSIWSRVLRVKITGSNGVVKLDIRIPAGFLEGLTRTIPGVAGINFREILGNVSQGEPASGQQLVDITDNQGDRIQVMFE